MSRRESVPLAQDGGRTMYLRADEVSELLRRTAVGWSQAVAAGEADLEPETTEALAGALVDLADQIDVECIARSTAEHEKQQGG